VRKSDVKDNIFIIAEKRELGRRRRKGVGVMRDKELKHEKI
jgi:hypothetical protein